MAEPTTLPMKDEGRKSDPEAADPKGRRAARRPKPAGKPMPPELFFANVSTALLGFHGPRAFAPSVADAMQNRDNIRRLYAAYCKQVEICYELIADGDLEV